MMFQILTLNNIAAAGLEAFPAENYQLGNNVIDPDAVLVRSENLHDKNLGNRLLAVGRAGAGVNNIPVAAMSDRGVPVFNAPGANANAVKELVLAGMLLAARHLCDAWQYVRTLEGNDDELHAAVESGKKRYRGFELPGRTLGVVGLGAVGIEVANAARSLGMNVLGFDPHITVAGAWRLSADINEAPGLEELYAKSDFISFHVPLNDGTRGMLNIDNIKHVKPGAVLMNFSRAGVVDEGAVVSALDDKHINAFVTDFPSSAVQHHPQVICLPHLGASTAEAEENCAVMVARQLQDYLEHGNIHNSVNFPSLRMQRSGAERLCIANRNVPDMIGQLSHVLGRGKVNIIHMRNESRGGLAYNLLDIEPGVSADILAAIKNIDGVLRVRTIA